MVVIYFKFVFIEIVDCLLYVVGVYLHPPCTSILTPSPQ